MKTLSTHMPSASKKLNSAKPLPLRPSNRFGECLDTRKQRRLYYAASRYIRKSGLRVGGNGMIYTQAEKPDLYAELIPADFIGQNGLRMCSLAGKA